MAQQGADLDAKVFITRASGQFADIELEVHNQSGDFPDTDPANANIDSRLLLRQVVELVHLAGWRLANLDATLVAQVPRMAPHINAMRANLAADLATAADRVNVKATTTEKLGFVGREEGIAAHAVVLLEAAPG